MLSLSGLLCSFKDTAELKGVLDASLHPSQVGDLASVLVCLPDILLIDAANGEPTAKGIGSRHAFERSNIQSLEAREGCGPGHHTVNPIDMHCSGRQESS